MVSGAIAKFHVNVIAQQEGAERFARMAHDVLRLAWRGQMQPAQPVDMTASAAHQIPEFLVAGRGIKLSIEVAVGCPPPWRISAAARWRCSTRTVDRDRDRPDRRKPDLPHHRAQHRAKNGVHSPDGLSASRNPSQYQEQ